MKVKLPNGVSIEGSELQVRTTLRGLGFNPDTFLQGLYYNSASRGPVLISEMETTHLRNAVLKMYKEWVNTLYRITDPQAIVNTILHGNPDPTFRALIVELAKREEE